VEIPPEYLPAEARPARIGELEHRVARGWVRFAIVEAIVLWIPFGVFVAVYVLTDAISDAALVPVTICFAAAMTLLTLYWVFRRVRPLQREIDALKMLESG
jgi:hypothetical protein